MAPKRQAYCPLHAHKVCQEIVGLVGHTYQPFTKIADLIAYAADHGVVLRDDVLNRVMVLGRMSEDEIGTVELRSGFTVPTIFALAIFLTDPATGKPYDPLKFYVRRWCGKTPDEVRLMAL